MNWEEIKSDDYTDYVTYGTNLTTTMFKICELIGGGYLLRTKLGTHYFNNIGIFNTLEKAKQVAKLIDEGQV